ncbi:hypothetical protein JDV09_21050 [Mycobacterium sp. Y57]|uniref:hypothetical protein n=1 Tax=Mycolicibacterium xanthum TaxID=2796469 RepID=UPI001C841ED7|nr:hypothetical protein [Mycolicibacterium xanthum]MBX7434565.1 hypothetical protein [Mycolicibacterium xanthum]
MTTKYPVDSAYYDCCNAIGTHTEQCPGPDIPVPAGATADGWNSIGADGVLVRGLEWSRHDTAKVGVGVDGFQDSTGAVCRSINLYLRSGEDLGADDARALAAKLIEAADKLDAIS